MQRFTLPTVIQHGERHITLLKLAASLRARGYAERAIHDTLIRINRERCHPPLTGVRETKEILSIVRWAASKPPGASPLPIDPSLLPLPEIAALPSPFAEAYTFAALYPWKGQFARSCLITFLSFLAILERSGKEKTNFSVRQCAERTGLSWVTAARCLAALSGKRRRKDIPVVLWRHSLHRIQSPDQAVEYAVRKTAILSFLSSFSQGQNTNFSQNQKPKEEKAESAAVQRYRQSDSSRRSGAAPSDAQSPALQAALTTTRGGYARMVCFKMAHTPTPNIFRSRQGLGLSAFIALSLLEYRSYRSARSLRGDCGLAERTAQRAVRRLVDVGLACRRRRWWISRSRLAVSACEARCGTPDRRALQARLHLEQREKYHEWLMYTLHGPRPRLLCVPMEDDQDEWIGEPSSAPPFEDFQPTVLNRRYLKGLVRLGKR